MQPSQQQQQRSMLREKREERERPHSEERRRSLSKKEKMQQIRLQFKSIVKKFKEIKSEQRTDMNELSELMKSGDRIHRMAHQSIEKAKQVLTGSNSDRSRIVQSVPEQDKEIVPFQLTSKIHSQSSPNIPKPKQQSEGSVVNEQGIVIVRQGLSQIERKEIQTTENSQIVHHEQDNISSSSEVNRNDNEEGNYNDDRYFGQKYKRYEVIVDQPDREDDQLSHSVGSAIKDPPGFTINLKQFTIKSSMITSSKINSPRPVVVHSQTIAPYIIALTAAVLILCTLYQVFK